jgi:signal transduction histidine kinase
MSSGATVKKDLLSIICHDLKDPLASIVMGAGYLRKVLPEDGPQASARRVVEAIHRSAERMNRVIQDFYDLGKIEAKQLTLDARRCDVDSVVRAATDAHAPAASSKSVKLNAQITGVDLAVNADRARLLQVLDKLIDNAIRFTSEGGAVRVRVEPEGESVRFRVEDTGRGIGAERLATVFLREVNATLTPRDGVGLGLAIAKGLVELQGGTISAESAVGKGSTFTFTLPQPK